MGTGMEHLLYADIIGYMSRISVMFGGQLLISISIKWGDGNARDWNGDPVGIESHSFPLKLNTSHASFYHVRLLHRIIIPSLSICKRELFYFSLLVVAVVCHYLSHSLLILLPASNSYCHVALRIYTYLHSYCMLILRNICMRAATKDDFNSWSIYLMIYLNPI